LSGHWKKNRRTGGEKKRRNVGKRKGFALSLRSVHRNEKRPSSVEKRSKKKDQVKKEGKSRGEKRVERR